MREVGKVVKGQLGKGFGLEALEVVFYRPEVTWLSQRTDQHCLMNVEVTAV